MDELNEDVNQNCNDHKQSETGSTRTGDDAPRTSAVRRAAHHSTNMLLKALTENLEHANNAVLELQIDSQKPEKGEDNDK